MADDSLLPRLQRALTAASAALLAERNARGFWEGALSSSALSTATAVTALAVAQRNGAVIPISTTEARRVIEAGLAWLARNQNADGGWGDTTRSLSNISTTTLGWAAFGAAGADEKFPEAVRKAEAWLRERIPAGAENIAPRIPPAALADAIIARYGKDRTFSVPILTMCALAGRLGGGRAAWEKIIPLPFELAACPHQLFAALRLPVVSYALPALIAIGQARHHHAPSGNPLVRLVRNATRRGTLRKLAEIQPVNGGFLEATPLTSFVTMSLAASGNADHAVTRRGLEFLLKSQRADGSWPIDTNLATWCTTLAVDALPAEDPGAFHGQTAEWLLRQQHRVEHPYTHAAPGGWAWTNLPGGVPDADDTAGALLALGKLRGAKGGVRNSEIQEAAEAGIRWLLNLQNRDGGIPTFCRGWGALPFDQSSADITAHAIRAWVAWFDHVPQKLQARILRASGRAVGFLAANQRPDGDWTPLWFGNQHAPNEENPIYGTAKVLMALREHADFQVKHHANGTMTLQPGPFRRGIEWLVRAQNADGSWGDAPDGAGSMEETALAVQSLAGVLNPGPVLGHVEHTLSAVERGTGWLIDHVESGAWQEPAPIGFYFAKLWYYERLYPMIFTVGALRAATETLKNPR